MNKDCQDKDCQEHRREPRDMIWLQARRRHCRKPFFVLFLVSISFEGRIYLLMAMYMDLERRLNGHQLCIKPNLDRVSTVKRVAAVQWPGLFSFLKIAKYRKLSLWYLPYLLHLMFLVLTLAQLPIHTK